MTGKPQLLVDARGRGTVVNVLAAVFIPAGAAFLWLAGWAGFHATDAAGNLEPLASRLGLAALAAGAGLVFSAGMAVYLMLYAMRLERLGNNLILRRSYVFGEYDTTIPITNITGVRHRAWRNGSVETPFYTVAIRGWRLPIIVDCRSPAIDEQAIRRLARG